MSADRHRKPATWPDPDWQLTAEEVAAKVNALLIDAATRACPSQHHVCTAQAKAKADREADEAAWRRREVEAAEEQRLAAEAAAKKKRMALESRRRALRKAGAAGEASGCCCAVRSSTCCRPPRVVP